MLYVNLSKIILEAKRINENNKLWAVVKNDAYGLGLIEVASALIKSKIDSFVCISLNEAIVLRDLSKDIKILLLGPIPYNDLDIIRDNDIIVSVNSFDDLKMLPSDIKRFVKINTSLNRFGIDYNNDLGKEVCYTHLAVSDIDVANKFLEYGNNIGSSKILIGEVRVGYLLYKNAISVIEPIIYIRRVLENSYVGYDYYTDKEILVGIINIGYYHGVDKRNKGRKVYINGNYYEIISICMNQTFIMIDESIKLYDDVELIGEHISIDDVSKYMNKSPYEELVGYTKLKRKYIK